MSCGGRKIVDDSKARGKKIIKAESQRAIEKEEITSTEFPEGENTISTKGRPASNRGEINSSELSTSIIYKKKIKKNIDNCLVCAGSCYW